MTRATWVLVLMVAASPAASPSTVPPAQGAGPAWDPADPLAALGTGAALAGTPLVPIATGAPSDTPAAAYARLLATAGLDPDGVATLPAVWTLAPLAAPVTTLLDATADAIAARTALWEAHGATEQAALRALDAAYRASRATGDGTGLETAASHHGATLSGLDPGRMAGAAAHLAHAALAAAPALLAAAEDPLVRHALTGSCSEDGFGIIILCGSDDDVITGDHVLEIDLGGDDRHLGNSGSAGFGVLFPGPNGLPASLALDLRGDDHYERESQTQGTGTMAPGVLIDLDGHDRYFATDAFFTFAQGAGHLGGVGLLYDALGDDVYDAGGGAWDTLGFGILGGLGVFVDPFGNDRYSGGRYSQGTGDFNAVGLFVDGSGWDDYAAGPRSQGFADGGGVGVLWDDEGHDRYTGGVLSQGASDGGLGILVDGLGNDAYSAPGGARGFGTTGPAWSPVDQVLVLLGLSLVGAGLFFDGGGSDVYSGAGCDGCVWNGGVAGAGVDTAG